MVLKATADGVLELRNHELTSFVPSFPTKPSKAVAIPPKTVRPATTSKKEVALKAHKTGSLPPAAFPHHSAYNPGKPVTGDTHHPRGSVAFSLTEATLFHCNSRGTNSAGKRKQKLAL